MENFLFLRAKQIERVEAIKKYIADNLDKDLKIDTLAGLFNIGASTLRTHILASCNQTVHHYVRTCRIERAKILLAHDHKLVKEVSVMVGFSECGAFTRAFKKYVGITPLQFCRHSSQDMKIKTLTNSSSLDKKSSSLGSLRSSQLT